MTREEVRIVVEGPPSEASLKAIEVGLDAYNTQFSPTEFEDFVVVLKTPSDTVVGGIFSQAWAGMLFIKWAWIDEAYRRQGFGLELMARSEEEGRKRGCSAVYLDTFDFQARPFYEKQGYKLFGEIDYPAGFKRYFLQKAL